MNPYFYGVRVNPESRYTFSVYGRRVNNAGPKSQIMLSIFWMEATPEDWQAMHMDTKVYNYRNVGRPYGGVPTVYMPSIQEVGDAPTRYFITTYTPPHPTAGTNLYACPVIQVADCRAEHRFSCAMFSEEVTSSSSFQYGVNNGVLS
jgi:hypothetical protein